MAYCELQDILRQIPEEELIQLTDDNLVEVDEDIVAGAITDADAEIDGYCMERYTVPFNPVPTRARALSVDISIYNLFARKQGPPEERATRYKDAVRFLENVAKGRASFGADAPAEVSQDGVAVTTSKDDRIFSRESLENY